MLIYNNYHFNLSFPAKNFICCSHIFFVLAENQLLHLVKDR
jgi:hypothetical protein